MNATELKTLRKSLWLTREETARMFNVQDRVYRRWETGEWPVPADVEANLHDLDGTLTDMAERALDAYLTPVKRHGTHADEVLIIYTSDEDLRHFQPDSKGLSHNLHACGVDRARQRLEAAGAIVRIVTMDRDAYEEWVEDQGFDDNSATRAAWAATVTDPPTRAKKKALASGED